MGKGNDKLARSRIPELGGVVQACRQDPSTVRTERRVLNGNLTVTGLRPPPLWTKEARVCPKPHPRAWRCEIPCLPSGLEYHRD